MSNKDLSPCPTDIKSHGSMWFYEQGAGIKIYCDRNEGEENRPIVSGVIPWQTVRAAIKRKDKS